MASVRQDNDADVIYGSLPPVRSPVSRAGLVDYFRCLAS